MLLNVLLPPEPLINNGTAPFTKLIDKLATELPESLYLAKPFTTPQSAFKHVTFAIKVKVVFAVTSVLFVGELMLTNNEGKAVTVIMVSLVLVLPLVSFVQAVKFITQPAAQLTVIFWLNCADVKPSKLKLKNLLKPVSLMIIDPLANSVSSVTLAVILIISFWNILVKDLFKVVFTIGSVKSTTVIIVSLVLKLPALSLTLIV